MDERLKYVSAMRVMAMMMIVAFHSMLFYTGKWWVFGGPVIPLWVKVSSFLDAIDLPMFVFIAGFLFGHLYKFKGKYRDKRQFVIGKARRLLVPYLAWGLFLVYVLPPVGHLLCRLHPPFLCVPHLQHPPPFPLSSLSVVPSASLYPGRGFCVSPSA